MPERDTRDIFEHDSAENSQRRWSGRADSRLGSVTPWCKALSRDEAVRDPAYGDDDDLDSCDDDVDLIESHPSRPHR